MPLAARFTPTPANPTARAGQARIQSLVAFGPTAGNPSQGSATADYYAPTHWAYVDELVFWGGSSGEGLILAPNAPVVDAAHRHGVPVLGNIFLPPVAYGGQLQLDPRPGAEGRGRALSAGRELVRSRRRTASTAGSSTPRPAAGTPPSGRTCRDSCGS